jgi:putative addiction module component (TIGR02574 family)
MNTKALVSKALKLPPDERFALIDELLQSLDRPDPDLDRIWIEEAERRLAAHLHRAPDYWVEPDKP